MLNMLYLFYNSMDDLKKLCKIFEEHVSDELKIHKAFLRDGKRTFKQHCSDTVRIHEKALKKVQALSK